MAPVVMGRLGPGDDPRERPFRASEGELCCNAKSNLPGCALDVRPDEAEAGIQYTSRSMLRDRDEFERIAQFVRLQELSRC